MTDDSEDETDANAAPSQRRRNVSLDGSWQFVTDPNGTGVEDGWMEPDANWPEQARTVDVPKAWQELDDLQNYTGSAWYRRTVSIGTNYFDGRDAVLRFGAVDYETTVWVNGQHVGEHRGGYLPFEFDITQSLQPGENTITVSVLDPADVREIPHGKQGDPWYTRISGIWQSVRLDFRPRTRVTDLKITPDLATDTADVDVSIQSDDIAREELTCTIQASRDGEIVATTTVDASDRIQAVLEFADPAYWTPDDPVLYDLHVSIERGESVLDRTTDQFGMRSFDTDGAQFLLNGEPFTIRGVLEQGYYPKTLYRPPKPETFREEIATAKELGFNLIRKHVKPAHPDFLLEADRQGILVWEEPANPTLYTDRSKREVVEQLQRLVNRDYNRPSVVIWSVYNEEWGIGHGDNEETLWVDREKQGFLSDTCRNLRERDPTRLVCDNSGWAHVTTDINDFHRYFVSPDRATEWEADLDHISSHPSDNFATQEFDTTQAPIVVSELGTWGFPDVTALREVYGGDPPWFDHGFLTEQHKRPADVDQQFAETDLSTVFESYESLAAAWQQREYRSVKHLLEATRARESIAGYVLTELSDIEWEFNGILDYRRERKSFYEEFAAVNAPVTVAIALDAHAIWEDDPLVGTATVINDTGETLTGDVEWAVGDQSGSVAISVAPHSIEQVENAIRTSFSVDSVAERYLLSASFRWDGRVVETTEPVVVVDETRLATPPETVYAEGKLASSLARRDVTVTHDIDRADIVFTEQITDEVMEVATDGRHVVQIPDRSAGMYATGPFRYHSVPERESWVGAASFFYQDSPLFDDVATDSRLGWELAGAYPGAVATGLDMGIDTVHVGYVEGWLANWGSPLVTRPAGSGSITAFTFDLSGNYGNHPTMTLVCHRLLGRLA